MRGATRSPAGPAAAEERSGGVDAAPGAGVLLVVNRRAGGGSAEERLALIMEALHVDGAPPTVIDLAEPGRLDARLGAALAQGGFARVVAAGGDGTVNSVLPALLETPVPLGIIPLGTGNDLARTLGIPPEPEAAARIVVEGRTRRIDVGSVNGRVFLITAGIGFSADLADMSPRLKGLLGGLAYPLAIARRWRRRRSFRVRIYGSGIDVSQRVVQVTVANGRHYGGGMTAHENASIDDGELDLLLIPANPWWQLVGAAVSLRRGVYRGDTPVVALRGTTFVISTHRPRPVTTDGEVSTATPATFGVLPQALEVCVPE